MTLSERPDGYTFVHCQLLSFDYVCVNGEDSQKSFSSVTHEDEIEHNLIFDSVAQFLSVVAEIIEAYTNVL